MSTFPRWTQLFSFPKPVSFSDEVEEKYLDAQRERFVPFVRTCLIVATLLYPLFIYWDFILAGSELLPHLIPVRLYLIPLYLFLLFLMFLPIAGQICESVAVAALVAMVFNVSHILLLIPDGFTIGLAGALVPFLLVPLMPSVRSALLMSSFSFVIINGMMTLKGYTPIQMVNANYFVMMYASLGTAITYIVILTRRKAYALELNLERMATTDELTGISNRRHFMRESVEVIRAIRYKRPLSILLLDIDNFKKINDTFGHHVGDIAIKLLATSSAEFLRGTDIVTRVDDMNLNRLARNTLQSDMEDEAAPMIGRLGGEEFAVLLPETDTTGAYKVAERLRRLIEEKVIDSGDGIITKMTVSIGVASLNPHDPNESINTMLVRADHALYRAKQNGRNQVVIDETILNQISFDDDATPPRLN
ncbi:GGDEF domain-containing protein [Micavibrio aeruginosavorus]|uniref:diguanylate cyclase n=1 Tax=Micavibrio aeruginosavorus EPB TaxID=349215 RepID=M4VEJ8_9BACT|nr:GGDEF domain-containing protein [Micavibrio aeruginosavorus]AGH97807.1 diguanylate cyclase domain-containing protein [Micavibrio aeruginosavorus EPB]